MPSEGHIVMIGLPDHGRTTFLAALWHQVESAEIPTVFVAETLQPDREYLNRIRDKWLAFETIPRTSISSEEYPVLHLKHVRSQREFVVSIPDVAGERFARQWFDRQLPRRYVEELRTSFGILLFVRCDRVRRPDSIHARKIGRHDGTSGSLEWEPELAPTQVQLVDFVQSVLSVLEIRRMLRLAIIVSAWDEIKEPTTPAAWLERELPLLDQFRLANEDVLSSEVFGVSAIGGSLADKDALALTATPSSRVRVHVGSKALRDLSMPLEFLTVENGEL